MEDNDEGPAIDLQAAVGDDRSLPVGGRQMALDAPRGRQQHPDAAHGFQRFYDNEKDGNLHQRITCTNETDSKEESD